VTQARAAARCPAPAARRCAVLPRCAACDRPARSLVSCPCPSLNSLSADLVLGARSPRHTVPLPPSGRSTRPRRWWCSARAARGCCPSRASRAWGAPSCPATARSTQTQCQGRTSATRSPTRWGWASFRCTRFSRAVTLCAHSASRGPSVRQVLLRRRTKGHLKPCRPCNSLLLGATACT